MSMDRVSEIESEASQWLVRRESGRWTEADQVALDQWLEASTLNRVAFLRLELAWEDAARLKALGAGVSGDEPPPRGSWNLTPFFNSRQPKRATGTSRGVWWAVAATLVMAIGVGGYLALGPAGNRYATPVGGIASVPMEDGSKVTLNTDSRITVDWTDEERRVELDRGEAFFEVAKDHARPFVVRSAGKRVIAVGTKFSVRRDDDDLEVVVTEGQVRIEADGGIDRPAGQTLLAAGSIAHAGASGVLVRRKSLPDAQMQLNWRSGVLTFRDQTLAEAVAEFNRYTHRKIVIEDRAVADLKVEGNFRADHSEAFVRLLESGFPVRASVEDERIVLRSR